MPDRVDVLVRWPKAVRGVDRVWWKPYTVHSAPVRFVRSQNAGALQPVDTFVQEVHRLDATQLRAECKRAGLDQSGDTDAMRARLLDLVGVDYQPGEAVDEDDEADTLADKSRSDLWSLCKEHGLDESEGLTWTDSSSDELREALEGVL